MVRHLTCRFSVAKYTLSKDRIEMRDKRQNKNVFLFRNSTVWEVFSGPWHSRFPLKDERSRSQLFVSICFYCPSRVLSCHSKFGNARDPSIQTEPKPSFSAFRSWSHVMISSYTRAVWLSVMATA